MAYYNSPPSSSYYDPSMTSSSYDPYPPASSSYYSSSYSAPTSYATLPSSTYPPAPIGYSSTEGAFGTSSYQYGTTGYSTPSVSATAYPPSPAYGTSGSHYSTPSDDGSPNYGDWSAHGRLKEHMCTVPGCSRSEGFTTQADLNRHQKSVHRVRGKYWICNEPTCPKYRKEFPRKDNLQDHLKRVHQLSKEDRDTLAERWAVSKD